MSSPARIFRPHVGAPVVDRQLLVREENAALTKCNRRLKAGIGRLVWANMLLLTLCVILGLAAAHWHAVAIKGVCR